MCLNLEIVGSVPEETVRIALAAFPKGNLYMRMRHENAGRTRDYL